MGPAALRKPTVSTYLRPGCPLVSVSPYLVTPPLAPSLFPTPECAVAVPHKPVGQDGEIWPFQKIANPLFLPINCLEAECMIGI